MSIVEERQENRIRKLAIRRGYRVRKDRARYLNLDHHGRFCLVDADTNYVVMGTRFEVSLEEIEMFLTSDT
jgi:hypothetical protein